MRKFIHCLFVSLILSIPVVSQQTLTNQVSFQVKTIGNGAKSLIFIPGFACSGEVWEETVSNYKSNFRCYVLTMPGFAGAEPQAIPSFALWTKQILQFIDSAKIKDPIIIGHSLGGVLALAVAAASPDKISKIVVVDALPCLPATYNPSFTSKKDPDCAAINNQIKSMDDAQFYKMQLQTAQRFVQDSVKKKLIVDWSMKSDRHTFGQMYCDFSNTDMRDKLKTITCPSLILLEPSFKLMSSQIASQYMNLKNATLHYAAKGLHFIMYDDKEWFDKELNDFIK